MRLSETDKLKLWNVLIRVEWEVLRLIINAHKHFYITEFLRLTINSKRSSSIIIIFIHNQYITLQSLNTEALGKITRPD